MTKIDTYRSTTMPAYGLVVPAGTDPASLQGEAGAAAAKLSPLRPHSKGVTLEDIFKGDLQAHILDQLATKGAGLVKTEVSFSEVLSG